MYRCLKRFYHSDIVTMNMNDYVIQRLISCNYVNLVKIIHRYTLSLTFGRFTVRQFEKKMPVELFDLYDDIE